MYQGKLVFAQDPGFAADYLNHLLQDGEPADLMMALRQLAQSRGGISVLAEKTHLNPKQLYRLFDWASFRSTKTAVKLHTLLDLRGAISAFIHVGVPDEQYDVARLDHRRPVQELLAGGIALQVDQAAFADQKIPGHGQERREDPNLVRHL